MAIPTVFVLWAAALALLYLLSRPFKKLFYPRPLPGIPYTLHSTSNFFGDLPVIVAGAREQGEGSAEFFKLARRLGSPVAQALVLCVRRPLVIVDDPREVEDILLRRTREFDRSSLTTQWFRPLLPHSTIAQDTTPQMKAQKRLWSDVMGADFLRRVVAPNVARAVGDLVDLWALKAEEVPGRPFEVLHDFDQAALDEIWVAIFGTDLGLTRQSIEILERRMGRLGEKSPSVLDAKALDAGTTVLKTMQYLQDVIKAGYHAPLPGFVVWLMSMTPRFRRLKTSMFAEIRRLVAGAIARFECLHVDAGDGGEHDTCAMDLVLRRKVMAARKIGLPLPDVAKEPAVLEELLLLLLGGHDSTANTLSWFAKLVAMHQPAQQTLRAALYSCFPAGTRPTAAAILEADISYLDAFIEEVLRVSSTAGVIPRVTTVATTILGCPVPAGTDVLLNTRFFETPWAVDENTRSPSSRAAQAKRPHHGLVCQSEQEEEGQGYWPLAEFEPRRWLRRDGKTGRELFDSSALPVLVFGGGIRGCFGKKLAMLELKITITLLVLNFEFEPLPEELRSMASRETLFRRPQLCHVKLRKL